MSETKNLCSKEIRWGREGMYAHILSASSVLLSFTQLLSPLILKKRNAGIDIEKW